MCQNALHEDCGGCDYPDERITCSGCGEVGPEACCCDEDVTVETTALDVPAVSEAEQVRRQFRDELVSAVRLANGLAARSEYPEATFGGALLGGVEGLLIRLCGLSAAEVTAAKGGGR